MTSNHTRNPGTPLDLDWVMGAHINKSAVERRTATLTGRRTVKKDWQAAWLLRAITNIDLTTLAGDDTPGRVYRLCAKAKQPLRPDMLEKLGLDGEKITVGAVCVYPNRIAYADKGYRGDGEIPPMPNDLWAAASERHPGARHGGRRRTSRGPGRCGRGIRRRPTVPLATGARVTPTLADWSAASTATVDVPAGMTDIVHTSSGDYLLNGQAVSFAFDRPTTPFQLVRFLGSF